MNAPTDVPHACTDQPDTDKTLCIATRPGFEVTVMREQSHRFNHAFLQNCPHKSQGAHLYYKWKHHASDDWMISNVPTIKCMTFARFGGSWVRCRLVSLQKRRTPDTGKTCKYFKNERSCRRTERPQPYKLHGDIVQPMIVRRFKPK